MGIGMILALLSLLATLSMDTAADLGYPTNSTGDDDICMFKNVYEYDFYHHQNFEFNLFSIQLLSLAC